VRKNQGVKGANEVDKNSPEHQLCIGDIYVTVVKLAGKLGVEYSWKSEKSLKAQKGIYFRPDGELWILGKHIYFEVERGSQDVEKKVRPKVQNYLTQKGWFYVIFTVQDYQPNPELPIRKTAFQSGNDILGLLERFQHGSQFLVTPHFKFVADPEAEVLVSPTQEKFSLQTLPDRP